MLTAWFFLGGATQSVEKLLSISFCILYCFFQLYHIAYIIIKSANSPRPGRFILERSTDYGQTYRPWQYFAGSDSECLNAYGMKSISDIVNDDDVICTAEYSNIVPLEDGEVRTCAGTVQ